jgi:MFS family permease
MNAMPTARKASPARQPSSPLASSADGAKQPGPAFRGARPALVLLLLINLFNYIDRYVLVAVVPQLKQAFFAANGTASHGSLGSLLGWCQQHLGFKPENALLGVLGTAFMVTYMVGAPVFGRLAERRSRWMLIGVGVLLWTLASGGSGLAVTFGMLLLTRCFVGIGEAAYGPVAPTVISDFYPVKVRGRVLAWFYIPFRSPLRWAMSSATGWPSPASALGANASSDCRRKAGAGASIWLCRRESFWGFGVSSCANRRAARLIWRDPRRSRVPARATTLSCCGPRPTCFARWAWRR